MPPFAPARQQADGSPATAPQPMVTLPVSYSASAVSAGFSPLVAACRSNGVVQALWVAAAGSGGSWITYLGIILCRDGTGTGPVSGPLAANRRSCPGRCDRA